MIELLLDVAVITVVLVLMWGSSSAAQSNYELVGLSADSRGAERTVLLTRSVGMVGVGALLGQIVTGNAQVFAWVRVAVSVAVVVGVIAYCVAAARVWKPSFATHRLLALVSAGLMFAFWASRAVNALVWGAFLGAFIVYSLVTTTRGEFRFQKKKP